MSQSPSAIGQPTQLAGGTIIARNYLARARVLAASFARHQPGSRFYVLVVDGLPVGADLGPHAHLVDPRDLPLADLHGSAFKYDLLELATRVKPAFLRFLLEELREEAVVYVDPDILVARPMDELRVELALGDIVLTPHLLQPLPADGYLPNEQSILRAGAYNLGFLALRRSSEASRFLRWWNAHLENGCRNDPDNGLFVDQRWIDLAPGLFPSTRILRDETYNVAYWNLQARRLTRLGGRYRVNGRPLAFFHFSGFDPERPDQLSSHQNRVAVAPGSALAGLLRAYGERVRREGQSVRGDWEYRYDRFDNGVRIPRLLRALYAGLDEWARARFGDPFAVDGPNRFFSWVTAVPTGGLSPFLDALYRARPDVAQCYPDPSGADGPAFLEWARTHGATEHGFDPRLVSSRESDFPARTERIGMIPENALRPRPTRRGGWGVNLCGYLRAENGLGAAARGYLAAIESQWIPTSRKDLSTIFPGRAADHSVTRFDLSHPFAVNLICANADEHFAVRDLLGEEFFRDRHNVGVWFWELPSFPDVWRDRFASFDEIWVASSFMSNAIAPVAPIPVVRIPPVLTLDGCGSRPRGRARLGADPGELIVLFIFDFASYPERKNPLAAIEAFRQAFHPSEPARLVIKCVNEETRPEVYRAMRERALGARVSIQAGYWDRRELRDLVAASDAYLSLHRAEGLGLTLAEAMAAGKPVIATGWSGNLEFMNVSNSFLVRYDLVQLERDVGSYRRGETWAEPSIAHAAELLRQVYQDRDAAREVGRRARRDLRARFSEEAVGKLIAERLRLIAQERRTDVATPNKGSERLERFNEATSQAG